MSSPSGPQRVADVLVLAAIAPDLAGMRAYLGDNLDGSVRNLRVRTKVIGLGLASASASAARGIQAAQPRAVVLLGTCGVYPGLPQYRPHDVVVATRATLVDHGVVARRSSFPEPMPTSLDLHPVLGAALSRCHARTFAVPVASTLTYTTDDAFAAAVPAATQCEAENLEVFGVATACRSAEVPFAAVLGVSNLAGSTARHDWSQFQRDAVTAAASAVGAWLHQGAPGIPHG